MSGEGRERRFGRLTSEREEGLLSYGSYLKIPELIELQQLRSDPPVHDELLFIVVHQAYELWFRQLLFELEAIRDRLFEGDTERARHYLVRVKAIERVLIEHIEVLRSMSPQDFLAFRSLLTPASGFQSVQFREVEFVSGLQDARYLEDLAASPEDRARLARRLEEPTVWDGFVALLERHGLPMPRGDAEAGTPAHDRTEAGTEAPARGRTEAGVEDAEDAATRTASLVTMARERPELFAVSEGLLDHDEGFATWRSAHVLMVERQIGAKHGTGGSSGVGYLRATLGKRFFPELWALRSAL